MPKYTRFEMKYLNKCSDCGNRLDPGRLAYGTRDDNGKWTFLCISCHDESLDPNLLKQKDVFDKMAEEEAAFYSGFLDEGCLHDDFLDEPKEKVGSQEPCTLIDLIKQNAQYGE